MRAVFFRFENINKGETLSIVGDSAKHLQVVRIKLSEELMVLNGKGVKAYTEVLTLSKHQIDLKVVQVEHAIAQHPIHLAIANPKKEAFEDILKMAVELGVCSIYPLSSEYSQYEYAPSERVERILESALIQSNNSFLPKIHNQTHLKYFLDSNNMPLYFFNSIEGNSNKCRKIVGEKIILIGPEGGFSPKEIEQITNNGDVFSIHLPTPILRAPTAVASSIGYLLHMEN